MIPNLFTFIRYSKFKYATHLLVKSTKKKINKQNFVYAYFIFSSGLVVGTAEAIVIAARMTTRNCILLEKQSTIFGLSY